MNVSCVLHLVALLLVVFLLCCYRVYFITWFFCPAGCSGHCYFYHGDGLVHLVTSLNNTCWPVCWAVWHFRGGPDQTVKLEVNSGTEYQSEQTAWHHFIGCSQEFIVVKQKACTSYVVQFLGLKILGCGMVIDHQCSTTLYFKSSIRSSNAGA